MEVLAATRTPGGNQISEAAWQALHAMILKQGQRVRASPPDKRLQAARGWYECAYEWRIVPYAMHAHARLNAKVDGRVLYYIPSIDIPAVRMSRKDFDDMRGQPNISTSAKFPGTLPVYMGMEMILTE